MQEETGGSKKEAKLVFFAVKFEGYSDQERSSLYVKCVEFLSKVSSSCTALVYVTVHILCREAL